MTELMHGGRQEIDRTDAALSTRKFDDIPTSAPPETKMEALARRVFDVVFSSCVLFVTAPIIALAAFAVRFDSPGPALFRQPRMGLRGREFALVKLRGMYIDAQERFPELYEYQDVDPTEIDRFHFHDEEPDPRVTRAGRLLRRYSIDELPNFWNVLRGDMSVVGPRPEIPDLAELYGPRLALFLSVKPGVTSPAKALGRDALSLEETICMDLDYIQNRTLFTDLKTVVDTALGIFSGSNRSA